MSPFLSLGNRYLPRTARASATTIAIPSEQWLQLNTREFIEIITDTLGSGRELVDCCVPLRDRVWCAWPPFLTWATSRELKTTCITNRHDSILWNSYFNLLGACHHQIEEIPFKSNVCVTKLPTEQKGICTPKSSNVRLWKKSVELILKWYSPLNVSNLFKTRVITGIKRALRHTHENETHLEQRIEWICWTNNINISTASHENK